MRREIRRRSRFVPARGGLIAAAVLVFAVTAFANHELSVDLFRSSNVNLNSWCYGFTLVWEAGYLAPGGPLLRETWTVPNTVKFVNAQVYSTDPFASLPHWVDSGNGPARLVSPPTLDVLARAIQEEQWGLNPPPGTKEERHDRYLAWLRATTLLVKDQDDLVARMNSLRGGLSQPLTVSRFDPRPGPAFTKEPPEVHNIRILKAKDGGFHVWDPNDAFHLDRTATLVVFDKHLHLGYFINGPNGLITVWWNNVFLTRQFTGRLRDGGPVEWENEAEPDTNWCCYEDVPDIDDTGFGY